MTSTRGGKAAAVLAVGLAPLLAIAAAGCGETPGSDTVVKGRGLLVSPYAETTACVRAVYRGPETALYSDRPYHTAQRVEAAAGLGFCRGARHGTNVWIVEISRPTTLVAFGAASFGLERRGWSPRDEALLVAAAGVPLDRVYTKGYPPGRYVIRQGFTRTAPLIFWDQAAVHLSP